MDGSDQLIDSEMKKTVWVNVPTGKIYNNQHVVGATFLGGPLVAGALIASNYKTFNQPNLAKKTWVYSILITIVLFGSLFLIPNLESAPRYIIPITMAGAAYYVVRQLQGESIDLHIEKGGSVYNFGRVAGIAILGGILTVLLVIGAAVLIDSVETSKIESRKYGVVQNEISFQRNNMTIQEIDLLASGLRQTTFFDQTYKKIVYVKRLDRKIILSIGVTDQKLLTAESFTFFIELRRELQRAFPESPFVINLFENNLENVIRQYN